jgi:hypothetical protein
MTILRAYPTLAGAAAERGAPLAQIRGLARRRSRIVYLALYSLIGIKESIDVVRHLTRGDSPPPGGSGPLRCCLACGVAALVVIRILAGVRAARRAAGRDA